MIRQMTFLLVTLSFLSATLTADEKTTVQEPSAVPAKSPTSIHELKIKTLEGKEVDLSRYRGKVLLIVNVASQCGATPQYEQLQALHQKYADRGLVVMGFPCNQFGAQEPGNAQQIREFCTQQYSVSFPMFTKINVNGDKQSPLYAMLKSQADDHSDIAWNFEKFVVSKDGKVVARFRTGVRPDAPELVRIIEEQLGL